MIETFLNAPTPIAFITERPCSSFLREGEKRILVDMEAVGGDEVERTLMRYPEMVSDLVDAMLQKIFQVCAAPPH